MNGQRLERVRPRPGAPVHVQWMGDARLDHLLARDLSGDGLAVCVPDAFQAYDVDSEVKIGISLPDHSPFVCSAQVKHTTVFEGQRFVGVSLIGISSQQRDLLEKYVQQRLREDEAAAARRDVEIIYPMDPPEFD